MVEGRRGKHQALREGLAWSQPLQQLVPHEILLLVNGRIHRVNDLRGHGWTEEWNHYGLCHRYVLLFCALWLVGSSQRAQKVLRGRGLVRVRGDPGTRSPTIQVDERGHPRGLGRFR